MKIVFAILILAVTYCMPQAHESELPLIKLLYSQTLCYWDTSNWDGCNWE